MTNDTGRARNPRPPNRGDGDAFHLASNAKGQPREKQDDQNDASERKLIDTIEQDNAKRAVPAANAGTRMARSTSNVSSGFVGSVRAALHVIYEGS